MRRDRAAAIGVSGALLGVVLALLGTVGVAAGTPEPSRRDPVTPLPRAYPVDVTDAGSPGQGGPPAASRTPARSRALEGTATIGGLVTGPSHQPVAEVTVVAYRLDVDAGWWFPVADVQTGADGQYLLADLAAGRYVVAFSGAGLAAEFWDDSPGFYGGSRIDLTADASVSGIDAELATAGLITGVVTDTDSTPVFDAGADVYGWNPDDQSWELFGEVGTDADGRYTAALRPGTYRVGFVHPDYYPEFWDDVDDIDDATDIVVRAGGTTAGIGARLMSPSHISGIVRGPDGQPVADVQVRPYYYDPVDDVWYWELWTWDVTDAQGRYDLGPLYPDTYRLGFEDYSGHGYVPEFWRDAATVDEADDVVLAAGRSATGVNVRLGLGSQITGTVTDEDGAVPTSVEVTVYRWLATARHWEWFEEVYADAHGFYAATGLPSGVYRLRIEAPVDGAIIPEHWDDAGSLASAVDVVVGEAATVSGHDAVLSASDDPEVVNTVLPRVSGPTRVGSTLTATPGAWTPTVGMSYAYRWFVDGRPVVGATTATYVPRPADIGRSVQAQVRATATGHVSRTAASAARTIAEGTLRVVSKPRVTGRPAKNAVLSVSPGTWQPRATSRVQWYAGGRAIPKATAARLKLSGATLRAVTGKAISVRVTTSARGYATVVTTLKVPGRL
ncbi:hypothetical protein [Nocardioides sp.]|uniref:hypothetical protein n=1 Tax=Nocardioides sp. TaxID=35761 RepID=UPI003783CFDD